MQDLIWQKLLDIANSTKYTDFFEDHKLGGSKIIYNSVDIRQSGFKIAPVDTNLYPAGFNNLSNQGFNLAVQEAKKFLESNFEAAKNILVISENHTRNLNYLDNLCVIKQIFEHAGYKVAIGTLLEEVENILELETAMGKKILLQKIFKNNNNITSVDGFIPDIIVMNNDLTDGIADIFLNINQPIIPSMQFGWYQRKKSTHFACYKNIVDEFAREFGIDPWLISADFLRCESLNFRDKTGIECLAKSTDQIISQIRNKYSEYGIRSEAYVFIKADNGTYGMGIMTAKSGEEVLSINKKIRNKMNVIKGGAITNDAIIQEGIPTALIMDGSSAEPLVYFMGENPVDVIFRLNENRDVFGNLNASGMSFKTNINHPHNAIYKMISSLAMLAAKQEDYSKNLMEIA